MSKKVRGICIVENCGQRCESKLYCNKHYKRWKSHGDPNIVHHRGTNHTKIVNICSVPNCGKVSGSRTMCITHSTRFYRYGDVEKVHPHFREYFFNEKFFDTWTKESSWMLGWLITDGNVFDKKSPCIRFELKDKEPLDIFVKLLNHNSGVRPSKGGKYWYTHFSSKYMVEKVKEIGVIPNKSLIVEMPTEIPNEYFGHFLRGVVEGDGCVYYKSGKILRIFICSASLKFIEQLKDKINISCSFSKQEKNRKNPLYRITYSGKYAVQFANWIYQDSEGLRLTRKYEKYQEYLKIGK